MTNGWVYNMERPGRDPNIYKYEKKHKWRWFFKSWLVVPLLTTPGPSVPSSFSSSPRPVSCLAFGSKLGNWLDGRNDIADTLLLRCSHVTKSRGEIWKLNSESESLVLSHMVGKKKKKCWKAYVQGCLLKQSGLDRIMYSMLTHEHVD